MVRLNLKAVEERVKPLGGRDAYDREFIFDLLLAYGKPRGNVTRLRNGSLNVAEDPATEVAQKNVLYFRETTSDPLAAVEELKTSPRVVRYNTRFVIATDYADLVAEDTKTDENLIIPIAEIDEHFAFFLPWAGMEKAQYVAEAHADVKAAERIGKLFDELLSAKPGPPGSSARSPLAEHVLRAAAVLLLRGGHRDLRAEPVHECDRLPDTARRLRHRRLPRRALPGARHRECGGQAEAIRDLPLRQRPPVHDDR